MRYYSIILQNHSIKRIICLEYYLQSPLILLVRLSVFHWMFQLLIVIINLGFSIFFYSTESQFYPKHVLLIFHTCGKVKMRTRYGGEKRAQLRQALDKHTECRFAIRISAQRLCCFSHSMRLYFTSPLPLVRCVCFWYRRWFVHLDNKRWAITTDAYTRSWLDIFTLLASVSFSFNAWYFIVNDV